MIYLLVLLLFSVAHAADLRAQVVECEPQRVHDNRYWSYRIIDGRSCWYPGRPGKPKTELRWSRHSPSTGTTARISEAEQPRDLSGAPVVPGAAPATGEEVMPDAPSGGRLGRGTRPGGGSDNAMPLPAIEETSAGALTTDALLAFAEREQLRKQAPLMPIAAPPQQEVVESMSIWKMTFIVLGIIGAISLIPIYKGVRNG